MLFKQVFRNISVTLLCTVVFFCIVAPFSLCFPMLGTTEIRPAAALYPSFGLVFGVWGALGCAFGNLALDIILGNSLPVCITSFFIQFSSSYLMYVMWYGISTKKQMNTNVDFPTLSKTSNILKYNILVLACSLFTAIMVGGLVDIYGMEKLFGNTAVIVFFNHLIFGILFGLPIVTLATKVRNSLCTPEKRRVNHKIVIFSNILLCLFLFGSITFIIYDALFDNIPPVFFYTTLCIMLLFLIVKPKAPAKDVKVNSKFIFSLNEKMVFNFTMCGVLLAIITGILFYAVLQYTGLSQIDIWERLCFAVAIIINLYMIISVFVFGYIEKRITIPVNKIADAVSAYDANNEKDSHCIIRKSCESLLEEKSEVGDMSKAIVNMLDDIESYTDTIRKNAEEKQKTKAQLEIAAEIQTGILPHNFDEYRLSGIDLCADMLPAKTVGGDFYDFFSVGKDTVAFVMGDVSGKGIPAALFMAMTKMAIEMYVCSDASLEDAVNRANSYICKNNSIQLFVTAFIAVYNTKSRTLTYVNAGHNPPLLLKNNSFQYLRSKSCLMLGVFDNAEYTQETIELSENDGLFMYTDGVTEANDKEGKRFGENRLLKVINNGSKKSIDDILNDIKEAVNRFSQGNPQFDDITMMGFKIADGKSLKILADTNNLHKVLQFIEENVSCEHYSKNSINRLKIIVEEIFVNICHYAYGKKQGNAEINVALSNGRVKVTFMDSGIPFDPTKMPEPDITQPAEKRKAGGMGIYMVKKLSDEISYRYSENTNIFTVYTNME